MKKPATTLPVAKTLAEQKSDFTAEGSPPPGKVSTSTPVGSPESGAPGRPPRSIRGKIKIKRSSAAPTP